MQGKEARQAETLPLAHGDVIMLLQEDGFLSSAVKVWLPKSPVASFALPFKAMPYSTRCPNCILLFIPQSDWSCKSLAAGILQQSEVLCFLNKNYMYLASN